MLTLDFTSSSWFWSPSTFLLHRTVPQRGQPSQEPLSAVPLLALCQAYDPSKHQQNWAVLLLGWFQHRDPPFTKRGVGRSKEKSWHERPQEPVLQPPWLGAEKGVGTLCLEGLPSHTVHHSHSSILAFPKPDSAVSRETEVAWLFCCPTQLMSLSIYIY